MSGIAPPSVASNLRARRAVGARGEADVGGGRYAGVMSMPSDPYEDLPYPDEPWGEPEEMDWVPPEDGWTPPVDWGTAPMTPVVASAAVAASAAPSRYPTALEALRTVFGYEGFRGDQAAIVEQVIGGGDAVVLMPTGGGKSITYQV